MRTETPNRCFQSDGSGIGTGGRNRAGESHVQCCGGACCDRQVLLIRGHGRTRCARIRRHGHRQGDGTGASISNRERLFNRQRSGLHITEGNGRRLRAYSGGSGSACIQPAPAQPFHIDRIA